MTGRTALYLEIIKIWNLTPYYSSCGCHVTIYGCQITRIVISDERRSFLSGHTALYRLPINSCNLTPYDTRVGVML